MIDIIKRHLLNISIIGIITLFMIFLYGQIEYTQEPYSKWDLLYYRAIAIASPQFDPSIGGPFAYRLLGPYIVGLFPIPDPLGFYIFTVSASFALVFLIYFFLCNMGINTNASVITTILFLFNKYLFGFTVWDFFQINDLLSLIWILILFWAMMRKNWKLFSIVMFLGAVTKETVMLMIPVVFVYLFEKKKISTEARSVLIVTVLSIVVFLFPRLLIRAPGNNIIHAFITHSTKLRSVENWFRLLVNPFIPLSLLPFIFLKRTIDFFRDKKYALVFMFLVFLSTLFGSNNERLMSPAFIVFYWLIGTIVHTEKLEASKPLILVIVLGTFISSFHHVISRFHFLSKNLSIIISLGFFVVITVSSFIYRMRMEAFNKYSNILS